LLEPEKGTGTEYEESYISLVQHYAGLRRRSAAAHLVRLWVRIPPAAWLFVDCECFVFSDRWCD